MHSFSVVSGLNNVSLKWCERWFVFSHLVAVSKGLPNQQLCVHYVSIRYIKKAELVAQLCATTGCSLHHSFHLNCFVKCFGIN